MNINFDLLLFDEGTKKYVCFKHAVVLAQLGQDIKMEIDEDVGNEYDCRDLLCYVCSKELE